MSKSIAITGVSRGLGRAMTAEFIRLGHTVAGIARNPEAVAQLRQEYNGAHSFDVVDVTDAAEVEAWGDRLLAENRVPDILINNAGAINYPNPLWQVGSEEFDRIVDINIKGVANVLRCLVPAMIQRQEGIIVNFSSGWGRSTSPQVAPYCATKWAIEGLTHALAQELPPGMAAIPLNPGIIHTDMLEICYSGAAANFMSPEDWGRRAVPYILRLEPRDNGNSLTVPA